MDRGAWWATVQLGCKVSNMTEWLSTTQHRLNFVVHLVKVCECVYVYIYTHTHIFKKEWVRLIKISLRIRLSKWESMDVPASVGARLNCYEKKWDFSHKLTLHALRSSLLVYKQRQFSQPLFAWQEFQTLDQPFNIRFPFSGSPPVLLCLQVWVSTTRRV